MIAQLFGGIGVSGRLEPRRTHFELFLEVKTKYRVALHRSEEGIRVWVPGSPGCVSQGDSEEEALANIADAIREYLTVTMEQAAGAEIREVEGAA